MRRKMVRLFAFLASLASPAVAMAGASGPEAKNVGPELRASAESFVIPKLQVTTASIAGTVGRRGILLSMPNYHVTVPSATRTSSVIGAMPYPAPLAVQFFDASDTGHSSNNLSCTSITLVGIDQYGRAVSETLTTPSETVQYTLHAFEQLDSVTTVGCQAYTQAASGDRLIVKVGAQIGLRSRVARKDDVISVCTTSEDDVGNDSYCVSGRDSGTTVPGSGTIDASLFSATYGTLLLNSADGLAVSVRIRSPSR